MSEALWKGDFGDRYIERNEAHEKAIGERIALWTRILGVTGPQKSVLEIGANIGLNLRAIGWLSQCQMYAIEPNDLARRRLVQDGVVPIDNAMDGTAQDTRLPSDFADLVFTSGVLIHIPPDDLFAACREIHRVSSRYIVSIEYFSDEPEEVTYHGRKGRLWKRDFGAYWLDNFPGLKPLACGFAWKRMTGLDNLTWWVFEK